MSGARPRFPERFALFVLFAAGAFAASACESEPVASLRPLAERAPPPVIRIAPPPPPKPRCPNEMALVDGRFCVDRWEASLVDAATGEPLSPYYPPSKKLANGLHKEWDERRLSLGGPQAQAMPLPLLPGFQRTNDPEPVARSEPAVVPSGYLSGVMAKRACQNAKKRLCSKEEWLTACEGEARRQFPYGERYEPGACNVFRATHPAAKLHDDLTMGHLDPRLNLVSDKEGPLLRETGTTPRCKSVWGDAAIYDMVGNLDEWIEDPKGEFRGGFFSRSTKNGCEAGVRAHGNSYLDYSLGVRCCSDPRREP